MNDITTLHSYRCDLNTGPREVELHTPLMHQDALADVFRVAVCRDMRPVDLTDMTVYGYLYFSATRQMLPLTGTVDGHYASVTLTDDCYALPGWCSLAIQLQQGNVRHTVLKVDFAIKRTGSEQLIVPGNSTTLDELIARIEALEQDGGGGSGAPGGYYLPGVTQPNADTMRVSYTPSKSGMPSVLPVDIVLPKGTSSGSGENGGYYLPGVTQPNADTMQVTYTPSKSGMANINPVNIMLPQGPAGKTPVKGVDYFTASDKDEIVKQVITAIGTPVFGTVDEENNIILTGTLADGVYTLKYEDEDGNVTVIGTLNHSSAPEPTYTNLFDPATATLNTRMSGSSSAPKSENGYVMTALIPIPETAVTKTSNAAFIAVPASMWSGSANMFLAKKDGKTTEGYCSASTTKGEVDGSWVKIPLLTEWGDGFTCNGVTLSLNVRAGSAITASDIQDIKICFNEYPK